MINPILMLGIAVLAQAQPRVLTLEEALKTAAAQPRLTQARAAADAARARVDQAASGLYPQVHASASYQRSTSNFAGRPGQDADPNAANRPRGSFDMYNYFAFGIDVNQLVWDFGQTTGRKDAAEASADSVENDQRTAQIDVAFNVRTAFFEARAQKALLEVAKETLANQERHLQQISAFVEIGSRPPIDIAQGRTDVANARVDLVNAENGYASAKAALNRAMGREGSTDYEVADEEIAPIEGEDLEAETMLGEALKARTELKSLDDQLRASEATLGAIRGAYWPTVGLSTALTEAGSEPEQFAWNWSIGVALSWPIFEGGLTHARVREAEANVTVAKSQIDDLKLAVRLELDQARFALRAAKAAQVAAEEALVNATERLKLAEGRYETGVGSIIELGDAQLALTTARAQRVRADYNLSTSRARLTRALGRA